MLPPPCLSNATVDSTLYLHSILISKQSVVMIPSRNSTFGAEIRIRDSEHVMKVSGSNCRSNKECEENEPAYRGNKM